MFFYKEAKLQTAQADIATVSGDEEPAQPDEVAEPSLASQCVGRQYLG